MERTMKKLDVIATKSFIVNNQLTHLSKQLINDLYEFLNKSYHLANTGEFQRIILQPEHDGELTVLYGMNDKIAGFSRIFRQSMAVGKKFVTTYIALVYLNPLYTVHPTTKNLGLSDAIKYKLTHPQEELVYVAFANNPQTYEFIYQLSDFIYPKPSQRVPDQILSVVNALKMQNGWISTNKHPMVINSLLVPIRSQSSDFNHQPSELNEFYLETNPDYMQGNTLLAYMPLHLANINYGLSHLDSMNKNTTYQAEPHHEGDSLLQKAS